jgi:gamma-glutamyltranspeptidase/glutathione hydrolase
MPFGVMGAHYQPFGHVHFLMNLIDYGLDVQEAPDMARLFPRAGRVEVERGIPRATLDGLTALGHQVIPSSEPQGGGQAVWIDWERGTLVGGSDPRKDGCALGY